MRKPDNYDLKKWLCENRITALQVSSTLSDGDYSTTWWTLTSASDAIRAPRSPIIEPLVTVSPDHSSVLQVKDSVREEVNAWDKFESEESRDLREYERLKKKFGNS